ncbi:MAG: four helix bundle protein [Ignavibacteriaceae bacterium]|nr:four helix bundle protein [Ignavibacteriaceae bacterium]MCK6615938.1 four helix bundle protein [Ignavibacteriaceae bacterium]
MTDNLQVNERYKNINRGFRKLEVWNEAVELFVIVRKKTRSLKSMNYKILEQIETSAFSVSSNIAEGYSRRHLKENIQFNTIALASLSENYSQIYCLLRSEDIDLTWFNEYDKIHSHLETKLVNYNKVQIQKLNSGADWDSNY